MQKLNVSNYAELLALFQLSSVVVNQLFAINTVSQHQEWHLVCQVPFQHYSKMSLEADLQ